MDDTWTIHAALEWTEGYLGRKGDKSPRTSAQWLLSGATGLSRIELYAYFDRPLSAAERTLLRAGVARRGTGEPLQYITGEVGFRHITVKVRPGVLIPRPETEVLVSEALDALPAAPRRMGLEGGGLPGADAGNEGGRRGAPDAGDGAGTAGAQGPAADQGTAADAQGTADGPQPPPPPAAPRLLVADLCTGSGCIACSLAYEHPQVHVVATDIAPEAVGLARENAAALGVGGRVEVVQGDLAAPVPAHYVGSFDLVISNPPYIPSAVLSTLPGEVVDFEPRLALDGGVDGLDLFRPIVEWSASALKPGGTLAVELHEGCLDEAAGIAGAAGFRTVRIVDDLAGRPRVLVVRKHASKAGETQGTGV